MKQTTLRLLLCASNYWCAVVVVVVALVTQKCCCLRSQNVFPKKKNMKKGICNRRFKREWVKYTAVGLEVGDGATDSRFSQQYVRYVSVVRSSQSLMRLANSDFTIKNIHIALSLRFGSRYRLELEADTQHIPPFTTLLIHHQSASCSPISSRWWPQHQLHHFLTHTA